MPSYFLKALENTQSILCGLFIVWGHFCSRKTASHRTALDFRGIFVLLEAGGLSPANDKRAKSSEKAGCPTCLPLLIDAYFHRMRLAVPVMAVAPVVVLPPVLRIINAVSPDVPDFDGVTDDALLLSGFAVATGADVASGSDVRFSFGASQAVMLARMQRAMDIAAIFFIL